MAKNSGDELTQLRVITEEAERRLRKQVDEGEPLLTEYQNNLAKSEDEYGLWRKSTKMMLGLTFTGTKTQRDFDSEYLIDTRIQKRSTLTRRAEFTPTGFIPRHQVEETYHSRNLKNQIAYLKILLSQLDTYTLYEGDEISNSKTASHNITIGPNSVVQIGNQNVSNQNYVSSQNVNQFLSELKKLGVSECHIQEMKTFLPTDGGVLTPSLKSKVITCGRKVLSFLGDITKEGVAHGLAVPLFAVLGIHLGIPNL